MSTDRLFIIAFVSVLLIAALFIGASLLGEHDKAVMKAGDDYTACVKAHFHMSPQQYLSENGSYPQCP